MENIEENLEIDTSNVNRIYATKIRSDKSAYSAKYTIVYEDGKKVFIEKQIPIYHSSLNHGRIIKAGKEFVNGYKVVEFEDHRYGYISEKHGDIAPVDFDLAFDFNEQGYAMVANAGSVSWIDTWFRYITSKGEPENVNSESCLRFDGWNGICKFSGHKNELSRLFCGDEKFGRTVYFHKNGYIKKFYIYDVDGQLDKKSFKDDFYAGTDFDDKSRAVADDSILSSTGICIPFKTILTLARKEGFVDQQIANAERLYRYHEFGLLNGEVEEDEKAK